MAISGALGPKLFLSPANSRNRHAARLLDRLLFWRRSQALLRSPRNPGGRMKLQATQPRRMVQSNPNVSPGPKVPARCVIRPWPCI